MPVSAPVSALALLALPGLHVAGLAARALTRGRPVTLFEVAQGTLAVFLGFGGAFLVLSRHGGGEVALGALALVLGALCYGAAFAFAERRPGQGRNFYFYSSAGGLLMLGGSLELGLGDALPVVWAGLGAVAVALGRRFDRTTLRAHYAAYLLAAALGAGLATAGVRALAGLAPGELPRLAWGVAVGAAVAWCCFGRAVVAGQWGDLCPRGPRCPASLYVSVRRNGTGGRRRQKRPNDEVLGARNDVA